MALLAIGLALVTYGALSWLGVEYGWTGDHRVIALAGSLAAIGLLLVVLGLAGWRAGFVGFLAVVLAISVSTSAIVPAGLQLGGRVGDATWAPTSVATDPGLGELKVLVPEGLTVQFVGHVGLGELLLPGEGNDDGETGTDVSRSVLVGNGPTEVVVDAEVGVGQLTVVKE